MIATRSVVLAGALSVLVLTACGGESKEDQAASAVTDYLTALADGEGQAACENLSGDGTRQLISQAVSNVPELGVPTCEQAVEALGGYIGTDEKTLLRDAEVETVELDGDSGTARLDGSDNEITLIKSGDRWLIDGGFGP